MTKPDMFRLQGMDHSEFIVDVPEATLGQQLGNAMSVNVIERVIQKAILVTSGFNEVLPFALPDRWRNGDALKQLQANRSKPCCPREADAIASSTALTVSEFARLSPEHLSATLSSKRKRFRAHVMLAQGETQRVLIDGSGATYHVVDFDSGRDDEGRSKRKLPEPVPLLSLQGATCCEYECDVWINELQLVITAMLIPGTPAILSMGKLVKELGFEV